MKKLIIISVLLPLFLISCGKTEEVTIVENPPTVKKQFVTNTPVVENSIVVTGSIIESNTGKIEEVSTWVISESNWIIYKNTEFGFQIQLPDNWKNIYKVVSYENNKTINFLLPTSDKEWVIDKTFPGYYLIFGLSIRELSEWNKSVSDCEKTAPERMKNDEFGSALPCENGLIGKTSQYAVTWVHPQDGLPSDFIHYNFDGVDYLKKHFEILTKN